VGVGEITQKKKKGGVGETKKKSAKNTLAAKVAGEKPKK